MQIYWTKINKIIDETPEVKTYLLDCPEDFTWEEGSHTHFGLEGFNAGDKPNRSLIRHMSISTLPHENSIGITTRIREQCSEFKSILRNLEVGNEVAIFKTHSNVPLKRENKNVYLLSSGVGLATFRPLVLDYFERADNVNQIHSLNIDSAKEFLFPNIFESAPDKKFTSQFVDNRKDYYEEVKSLAADKDGLFYVVGSDEFLVQNIEVLREQGIKPEQIMLDKREQQLPEFLSFDLSI
ncbi:dihydropteridine reductase [Oceanobacillus caeni]|uniref:bifunctional nitric oxide dioxygenase/dihydropteridine reductase 2 n=1 Tax=Oceanobacillus TaxID=182709 RepID=UPI0006220C6B|nr:MULTISPECIES: bifunctional nitric oxide dioxygenase/dihydropteridine reductase 2 [Oceanobacillus]KKE78286.1 bifunctional nitric oxide dioxygenase/dihydropteridine reductase 2 [Bacilli bacterium VT-13-104]PZD84877.1 dihydropteridine reductase [Bacilli bacterium]MCR1833727.1 dihydropteridine reductase [Oceanobacillus caeni]PZD86352.1 dihydropteridine reductase [Bacilli bacterium]PZD89858.1 dihydropteridine reductase [Bacilli bacterium]